MRFYELSEQVHEGVERSYLFDDRITTQFAWDVVTNEAPRPRGLGSQYDGFMALYHHAPHAPAHPELERWVMESDEWREIRSKTTLRAEASFYASLRAANLLQAWLRREDARRQQESAQTPEERALAYAALQGAKSEYEQALDALQKTVEEADALHQLEIPIPAGRSHDPANPTVIPTVNLSYETRSVLRLVSQLLGRLYPASRMTRRGEVSTGDAGYELGRDLERVDPTELLLPGLEHRYAEGKLLQIARPRRPQEEDGDAIILVDESGSMNSSRIVWAKAAALVLCVQKRRQNRRFCLISFADNAYEVTINNLEELNQWCSQQKGGGTDFDRALRRAAKAARTNALKRPDVCIITDADGYQGVPEGFAEWRSQSKARLWAIRCASDFEMPDAEMVVDLTSEGIIDLAQAISRRRT